MWPSTNSNHSYFWSALFHTESHMFSLEPLTQCTPSVLVNSQLFAGNKRTDLLAQRVLDKLCKTQLWQSAICEFASCSRSLPRPDLFFYHLNSEKAWFLAYYTRKYEYSMKISSRHAFFDESQRNLTVWANLSALKVSESGEKVGHVGYAVWTPVQATLSFSFLGLKRTKTEKARGRLKPYFILMLSLKWNLSDVCRRKQLL